MCASDMLLGLFSWIGLERTAKWLNYWLQKGNVIPYSCYFNQPINSSFNLPIYSFYISQKVFIAYHRNLRQVYRYLFICLNSSEYIKPCCFNSNKLTKLWHVFTRQHRKKCILPFCLPDRPQIQYCETGAGPV